MYVCLCKNSSEFPPEKIRHLKREKWYLFYCLKPPLVLLPLASGKVEHIKICCSLEIKLLLFAEGRAEHLQGITVGLQQARTVDSMEDCRPLLLQGKINICSTASTVLSLSFLWLFFFCVFLFLPFAFYLFMPWLAAVSQLTDGWFHLATWGSLLPSKFLSQVVSRSRLLVSAVLARAWSRKSVMQIFVHFVSSMSVCWRSSRWLRDTSSGLLVPKGQHRHLLYETQVGPGSLVCRDPLLCNAEYEDDLVHSSLSDCFIVVIFWCHCS